MSARLASLAVLLGAILWGTAGTAITFMPATVHPLAIGAMRLSIGGMSLFIVLILFRKISLKNWPWGPTLLAALTMAAFQFSFFTSVRLTGVAIGTVVGIGSAPVFSGIIQAVVMKEKPSRIWVQSTTMAILGAVLLFANPDGLTVHPLGVAIALGSGVLFAIYTAANKAVVAKVPPISAVAVIFTVSALFLLPFLRVTETTGLFTSTGWAVVIYLGFATTTVAYLLFSTGLRHIPSSNAVTLSLAEPLTAALLSVIIVGERLNLQSWLGIFMLLGSIILLARTPKKSLVVAQTKE